MRDRLSGQVVCAIRNSMNLEQPEFALLFGVTVRTVQLWESGAVEPSLLTSMVIRAEAEKHRRVARPARTAAAIRGQTSTLRLAARSAGRRRSA